MRRHTWLILRHDSLSFFNLSIITHLFFTSICSFQSYVRFFLRLFLWLSLVQCNFLTDVVILVFCFFSFLFSFAVLFLFGFFLYTVSLPRVFILFRSFLVILSFYYKRRPIENQHPLDPRLRSRLKIARTHTHTHRLTDSQTRA